MRIFDGGQSRGPNSIASGVADLGRLDEDGIRRLVRMELERLRACEKRQE